MLSQAEQGFKLFEAQKATQEAEYDSKAAESYKAQIESKIAALEAQARPDSVAIDPV